MASTITYRGLSPTGDPLFGQGQGNFLADLEAVAQAIATRLKFLAGEWWENLNAGTPLFQEILGVPGQQPDVIALIIQQRILGTPYVTGVSQVATSYNSRTRAMQFSCSVQTQFGTLTITNQPAASASLGS